MPSDFDDLIRHRAEALFLEHRQSIYRRTDRLFAGLMVLQWLAAILAAYWVSPLTWSGRYSQTHLHVWAALFLGGVITVFPVCLALMRPGRASTRHVVGVGQMLMSALLIHLSGGRIETHFHVFGSLAFLAFYRDWRVFIPATVVVAADHFLRGVYWPESVYGVLTAGSWRWVEHAAWVCFEDTFLIIACLQSLREMRNIAWQRAELEVANEKTERVVVTRTAELKASEGRFRSLSAASPIGIFETDPQGRGVYVNARWGEIAGMSPQDALGEGWKKAIHPDDLDAVIQDWSVTVGEERESASEFRIVTPSGDTRWISARSKQLVSEGGTVTGQVITIEDINERKRAAEVLAEARDRALEAARLKSEFLANMSHEIRTPMNAVIGMTDMALDTDLTEEQREYLETVKLSSKALLTLLNDILDLSKIESGRMTLESAAFSLRDSLGDMLRTLAVRAHQKGLELACDVPPDVPDAVVGDPGRLRQVVINLVGNAIKFTERGEVTVRFRTEARTERDAVLHFTVADTGIGIAADKRSVIFAPFVQGDGSMTRQYGGTGLGLTIASQLVEMMAGRIWVESEVGRGSTFHFTVSFALGVETRAGRARAGGLDDVRVLVVDDSATTRGILVEMLHGWGMIAVSVESGAAALAALDRARQEGAPFGVALLDARMPGMDGVELANRIRENPALSETAVILLIPSGLQADGSRELRGVGHLMKPVVRSHLLEAIQAVRGGHTSEPRHFRAAVRQSDVPLRVLVAEDNAVNRKMAVRLLEKRGHAVVAVEDGREALAALDRQPFDLILMDVQMPGMDGFEATAAIRAREETRRIPIVALTAHAMQGDRDRCLKAGMDAYVAKPVEAEELFATIEQLASGKKREDAEERPREASADVLDRDTVFTRVGGDPELLLEMVSVFRDESAKLLHEIRRGVSRRDSTAVERAAHSLKGALAALAARAASEAALRLESIGRERDLSGVDEALSALEHEMGRLQKELCLLAEAPIVSSEAAS